MAPNEVRPIVEQVRPQFVFDANPDGPWPRTRQELVGKSNTLLEVAMEVQQEVTAAGPGTPVTGREAYVHGVWAAAFWTLAAQPDAPVTRQPIPVTDAAVSRELVLAAEILKEADDPTGVLYAGGAYAWLSWLVGWSSDLLWPE